MMYFVRFRRYRVRAVLMSAFLLAVLAAPAGCRGVGPPAVVAKRIESRSELPGGPVQYGEEGDFLLENSWLKAVVSDKGHAISPALWGGALVDVDLVRPYNEFLQGNGLEQFFLILPMVNLNVPNPRTGSVEPLLSPDGNAGLVRVVGRGDRVLSMLNLMDHDMAKLLGLKTSFALSTDYVLEKDARVIRIVTTLRTLGSEDCADGEDNDGDGAADCMDEDCSLDPECPDWCADRGCPEGTVCDPFLAACMTSCGPDGSCATGTCETYSGLCIPEAKDMPALAPGTDLVDVLSGGLLSTAQGPVEKRWPGYIAGDMVLFGANAHSFVPGIGYEVDTQYRLVFLRGGNPLTSPPSFDFMAATGDRVSYAYFSLDGAVLFPFSTESLTGSMTHGLNCLIGTEDDEDCDNVPFLRFTRYVAVGDGDVASVLETIYKLRGVPHGHVKGQVVDQKTVQPVSAAQVFAIQDPCDEERCAQVVDGCGDFETYAELAAAARYCTSTPENPDGIGMVASQFRTDVGMDHHPDGRFRGPLEPGTYYLVASSGTRPLSIPAGVTVEEGKTTSVALVMPRPGTLSFRVLDEAGSPAPARVTVGHCFRECRDESECPDGQLCDDEFQCRPEDGCASDLDCDPDEVCVDARCACSLSRLIGEPWEELGGGYLSDRKVTVEFSLTGTGQVELPPGRYDVIFSRGIECSIDSREVEITSDRTTFIDARVARVVDTSGWLSVDQHVHGEGSPDSSISDRDRIVSAVTDGLEVMVMTDHDYITNLEPAIRDMGILDRLAAFPGEEVTTLDISHLIGWPLDWTNDSSTHGALEWVDLSPDEIFSWIRSHGLLPPEETLVSVPHPRGGMSSYFDVYCLNPYTLELEPGMVQELCPLLDPVLFSPAFDMLEIMNSKRFDILRTPTYGEVLDFQVKRREILAATEGLPRQEIVSRLMAVSREAVKGILVRDEEEQDAIWNFTGAPHCRLPEFCQADDDCSGEEVCGGGVCKSHCEKDSDCPVSNTIDGQCSNGFCVLLDAHAPCDVVKGLTDDWLRMLSFGVFKTGVGGSDVHSLVNFEMGHLRNYVRSPTDDPVALSLKDLVHTYREGRSFATYGPFVDFTIGGKGPGEIARMDGGAGMTMHIRVQSPLWFDVSRVEILRNGRLEHVFDTDAADPDLRITVPNDEIVNLDVHMPIAPSEDSWYVAFVMGVKGRAMDPVYGSLELPPVYLGDIFTSVFGGLPVELPTYIVPIKLPVYYPQLPVAVTNPIFVDVDGDVGACTISPSAGPVPDWLCAYPDDYPSAFVPCVCRSGQ